MALAVLLCGCGGLFWVVSEFFSLVPSSLVRVSGNDQELQQAIKTARGQLPKFEERLKHPEAGDRFAIKAKFATPIEPEYLWIKDPVQKGTEFTGILDQVPIAVPNVHKGDRVTVNESDVVDWFVRRADGSMAGRFTDLVLGSSGH